METLEKNKLKLALSKKIDEFIGKIPDNHSIGWIPNNIESLMADAAFAVLETVIATNDFMKNEDLLK